MRFTSFVPSVFFFSGAAFAQSFSSVTDANGIKFYKATIESSQTTGGLEFGLALPESGMTDEYIGQLTGAITNGAGWTGLSHGGAMTSSLLLVAWADGDEVKHSFRYASGYVAPDIYTGNASLTPISSSVNSTHWTLTYRCQWCFYWEQDGVSGSNPPATTASAVQLVGWVQATDAPSTPSDADSSIQQHESDGLFGAAIASARNADYTSWISLATATPTATGATGATGTAAATGSASTGSGSGPYSNSTTTTAASSPATTSQACSANDTISSTTYDYIIVGGGAGGIPMADKLSAAGHSVLLIERGPPSSGRWGGAMRPDWLSGTNLTRFDVPGLCNEIWVDSAGIACSDVGVMAGCVLGGGTAVNAALWWKANPKDFDETFPDGWKSADMQPAVDRVFEKIPWTDHPSADGQLYLPSGYNVVGNALAAAGWKNVTANDTPGEKNQTFSHTPYMYSHGERGGPMATYLVEADARSNFKLWMNTTVNRVVRDGSHITGVEVQNYGANGFCGTVNVTPGTGRVILSAGTFGTSKILFRSGIGPADQLNIVKASASDGVNMIDSAQWINLPVGHNLQDHANTDIVIQHPNVTAYDWYGAYKAPIAADKEAYLSSRTGPLTQSAPDIGPMFWEEITGSDGSVRQLQYTARVEGGHGYSNNHTMVISQYLGRGYTSRGKLGITSGLAMTVTDVPYLQTDEDNAAAIEGIKKLQQYLSTDPKIEILYPSKNQTVEEFFAAYPKTTSSRGSNHWLGACKMGTDSGLQNGTAVVDTNTKVYGTDNLFVVDASIFPGMVSTNPSALIVAVSEHASEKILALPAASNTAVAPVTGSNNTVAVAGTNVLAPSGAVVISLPSTSASANVTVPHATAGARKGHPSTTLSTARVGGKWIPERCDRRTDGVFLYGEEKTCQRKRDLEFFRGL
ncbi:hypothetical protein H2203_001749 [Taxawa tesnikishii (nom. ined.)]|nr:hypothetical protein H2203_001749 [Dothideales sp. JES 119]